MWWSDLLAFLGALVLAAAFLPRPAYQVSAPLSGRLSRGVFSRRGTASAGPRRLSWAELVVWRVGRLLSLAKKQSQEAQNRPIYPNSRVTVVRFNGIKVVTAVAGTLAFLVVAREFGSIDPVHVVLAAACGFWAPSFWLRAKIQRRRHIMLRLLPEVIDLLTLCVGAGLDFLGALNKIVLAKSQVAKPEPLIEELSVVLQEIRLGKRRVEALRAMAQRVELQEISSLVRTIIQADRMGTPMAEALAVHSEDVRMHRFMRAERAALRAPVKILIPLIFFIMPCVAIIVGAPILLQFMRQNPFTP